MCQAGAKGHVSIGVHGDMCQVVVQRGICEAGAKRAAEACAKWVQRGMCQVGGKWAWAVLFRNYGDYIL